ncbi:LysR family transcriptional regulator [Streptoalloteichus hindustanus]|uniref:DNA-binding transcriptional regulator, LysR family n=1 Tax=Streptoalloteichus hindustanus TaxID=2017 RepID=A0A1M5P4P1_STRHI|nr:LysR family transcriptional regulator [Streptoalloteichus hindustanus]SHG96708.1 DNA-binding transcriptional regulator, LysR family [Streptoalloteichus hindustanus]
MSGGRDPSVHQLRLLLTLAEELHFGRAADRLFMTQSGLSRQIRALEERLRVKLIRSTTRRVELTSAGQALLPQAEAVVAAMDELHRSAALSARSAGGRLVLGMFEGSAALPSTRRVLAALGHRHPDIAVDVLVVDFVEQVHALRSGRVDAAFVYFPHPAGVQAAPLTSEDRLLCVASTDPVAGRAEVDLADLRGYPVVSVAEEVPQVWRDFWAVDPRPDGTRARHTSHQVTNLEALLSAVGFGDGIAFVPASTRTLYPRPGVAYVPVRDLSPCTSGVLWPSEKRDDPGVVALRRICADLHPDGAPPGT